jgi:tetratricopeptide (TPR) repeat protein
VKPGTTVADRFVLESEVGSGGMGTVFRAVDRVDGAVVAVKILRGQAAVDVERFEREATVLAGLRHPGVVRYVAHGVSRTGERYLAMEWLQGEDLAARLVRQRLSVSESLRVMRRAVDALAFAHRSGLVHRDVKPSNIFIVGGDVERIKLVDFGIARASRDHRRLTGTGMVLGTLGYISPEQLQSPEDSDPRSDVFSLGCVLFECLTGRPAFEGVHVMAVLLKIVLQQTPRVRDLRQDIPEALDALVARMMAKAPGDRFQDAAAVARAIDALDPIEMGPPASADARILAPTLAAATDRAPSSITRNEQRLVTVVLAGEAAELEREAPPSPRATTAAMRATRELEAALDAFGGHVTELPGRSLVVTQWGGGSAVDRAERAAQCALTLRAHMPGVAICVATGRGQVSARVVEGEVLDRGVRMLRRTRPDAIKLDDVSAGMIESRVRVIRERGGFVLGSDRIEQGAPPRLLGKPTVFQGRTRELSSLEAVLAGCIGEPVASAVLVVGTAGTGKSRLRREFLDKARARPEQVEVLSAWADSLCPGTPFGIIADAIRRAAGIRDDEPLEVRRRKLQKRLERTLGGRELASVAPFLGELVGAPFSDHDDKALRAARENAMLMGDAMRGAWEAWLGRECAAHPVLLVIEDLHWGDAASVRLVDSTLRNLRELPLMVLVLARPEVSTLFPGLWSEREVQTIKLGPLARKASEKLVRDALGAGVSDAVVARVLDRADGNPFYLEELVRAVAAGREDALPSSVLGTVEARLDAEGEDAKRVLRAASVFGDRFSTTGVAWLLGGEVHRRDVSTWLDALASHELVTPAGATTSGDTDYVFRHTLVREAAYGMLTEADCTLGHRLAAEWLELHGSADATAMAEHFRRGEQPARGVRWYRRAAEQALEANELTVAIDRAEQGVSCDAVGDELGMLRLIEAEANLWRGELAIAEERGLEALRLLPKGTPSWFRAVNQVVLAAGKLSCFDRVETWVEATLATAPAAGADGIRLSCLSWAALLLILGGRYGAADAVLEKIGHAAGPGRALPPQTAALIQQTRAVRALYNGDSAASLDGLKAALAAFEESGDRRNASSIRSNLGFLMAELGDYASAEEALRSTLADADRLGIHDVAIGARLNLGYVVAYRGRLEEARDLEQSAFDALKQQGDLRLMSVAQTYLAKIALLSGDFVAAEYGARTAAEALRVAPPQRAAALAVLSRALLALGRPDEALPVAREAFETLESLGMIEEGEALVRLVYAEALGAAGLAGERAAAIADARDHLLARAAKIGDPAWRRRFLLAVPDHARTLASDVPADVFDVEQTRP